MNGKVRWACRTPSQAMPTKKKIRKNSFLYMCLFLHLLDLSAQVSIFYPSIHLCHTQPTYNSSAGHNRTSSAELPAVDVTQGRQKKSSSPHNDMKMSPNWSQNGTDGSSVHKFGRKLVWMDSIRCILGSLWAPEDPLRRREDLCKAIHPHDSQPSTHLRRAWSINIVTSL